MSQLDLGGNNVATETQKTASAYVPPLQRRKGSRRPLRRMAACPT